MRNFFSKFFCPHFIDLEISLFCKQTGPRYVNKWLKQISLPFLYSPWIVETPELCYKKWPDFYLKLSRSISVKVSLIGYTLLFHWKKVCSKILTQKVPALFFFYYSYSYVYFSIFRNTEWLLAFWSCFWWIQTQNRYPLDIIIVIIIHKFQLYVHKVV